jgi:hypothetical protein
VNNLGLPPERRGDFLVLSRNLYDFSPSCVNISIFRGNPLIRSKKAKGVVIFYSSGSARMRHADNTMISLNLLLWHGTCFGTIRNSLKEKCNEKTFKSGMIATRTGGIPLAFTGAGRLSHHISDGVRFAGNRLVSRILLAFPFSSHDERDGPRISI